MKLLKDLHLIAKIAQTFGMYLVKKYAAEVLFDWIIKGLEYLASKTETLVDDDVVRKVKAEKAKFLEFAKT